MTRGRTLLATVAAAGLFGSTTPARAESWCATRLIAHEWGVQLFDAQGAPHPVTSATLPASFHRQPPSETPLVARISDLPPDSGIRLLPLLHFYAPGSDGAKVPLGLTVGFPRGAATAWYPQVDVWRSREASNSAAARAIRGALHSARSQLQATLPRPVLPDDPTQQLQWSRLELTKQPAHPPGAVSTAPSESWVGQARQLPDALWVEHGTEAERFVFYEAGTTEHAALRIRRGATAREYVIDNPTQYPVHDVFLLDRQGATRWMAFAPTIAAGGHVEVKLAASSVTATREALRKQWIDNNTTLVRDGRSACVMSRDPAIPVEAAGGHRLYGPEVDLMLTTWAATIFDSAGTTVVYREDVAYLDAMMPLSLFTDMYHYVELRRLGLAIWQNVALP